MGKHVEGFNIKCLGCGANTNFVLDSGKLTMFHDKVKHGVGVEARTPTQIGKDLTKYAHEVEPYARIECGGCGCVIVID
jgi:hypothetical protein